MAMANRHDRWVGRVALVTGASAGIGAAVARRFAQLGLIVIGCARNIDKIKSLEVELKQSDGVTGSIHAIKCDVAQEKEILSMFGEIKEKYGGVDVCVNSAGINYGRASILEGKTEDWKQIIDVNVIGLSICTREAIKSMRERQVDDGHIIHLNSMSGHIVGPSTRLHLYNASKFAVTALTEGLRQELREIKSHIRVTSISPGLVETEFAGRAYGAETANELYKRIKCLAPDDIADAVVYVLQAPPHVQVHDILVRPVEQEV